jgi:hypothetical protein
LETLWAFLSDSDNQRTLAWLGGGLVVTAGGLWAVIKFFFPRSSGSPPSPSNVITADRGGIGAGGSVTVTKSGMRGLEVVLLVAVVAGALLLAAAFAGTRIDVSNGVGVGGDVQDSTITIQRSGSVPP